MTTAALALIGMVSGVGDFVSEFRLSGLLIIIGLALAYVVRDRWAVFVGPHRRRPLRVAIGAALLAPPGLACAYLVTDIAQTYAAPKPDIDAPLVGAARGRDLSNEHVTGVSFAGMDLSRTNFSGAYLRNVDFEDTNLDQANLRSLVVNDVNFAAASLCGVDLRGADLRSSHNLESVSSWRFAVYDAATLWPDEFDIESYSGPVLANGTGQLFSCTKGMWGMRPLTP